MAQTSIGWQGVGLRFLGAAILVFSTYNPEGFSYFHWLRDHWQSPTPLLVLAGILLLIGWTVFIRATLRSLGAFGLFLAFAFFGSLLWLVVDWGLVPADSVRALTYIILVMVCGVLAAGMSWSHIRRRLTGQIDVDNVDED